MGLIDILTTPIFRKKEEQKSSVAHLIDVVDHLKEDVLLLKKRINQLECSHLEIKYEPLNLAHNKFFKKCRECDKDLGMTTREQMLKEKMNEHLTKAKEYEEKINSEKEE